MKCLIELPGSLPPWPPWGGNEDREKSAEHTPNGEMRKLLLAATLGGYHQSPWAALQAPERGLWAPMRADVLVSSVSLACWRGRDVQDRRASTRPTEPRTPLRTESAAQTVPPPPSLSPAVGKAPVPPRSGKERSFCCYLELVEGPRNRSQGHILVTAWVGAPPAPEEASHP